MAGLYPLYFDVDGRPCLVVGGGSVALRKVRGLLDAGAQVTLVAIEALKELHDLAREGAINLLLRAFQPGDVQGMTLVFCATDQEAVSESVFSVCESLNIPVNVADVPRLCRFHVPGRYRRGSLQVAVSTAGKSPAFSRWLRREMDDLLDDWAPRLVEWLGEVRERLKRLKPGDPPWRGAFLNRLVDTRFDAMKSYARAGDRLSFDALVNADLEASITRDFK